MSKWVKVMLSETCQGPDLAEKLVRLLETNPSALSALDLRIEVTTGPDSNYYLMV